MLLSSLNNLTSLYLQALQSRLQYVNKYIQKPSTEAAEDVVQESQNVTVEEGKPHTTQYYQQL